MAGSRRAFGPWTREACDRSSGTACGSAPGSATRPSRQRRPVRLVPERSCGIAGARMIVIDTSGRLRSVALRRIPLGGAERPAGSHYEAPVLVVDAGHGFVVAGNGLVADVALAALTVRYH